jgi:Glycine zipper
MSVHLCVLCVACCVVCGMCCSICSYVLAKLQTMPNAFNDSVAEHDLEQHERNYRYLAFMPIIAIGCMVGAVVGDMVGELVGDMVGALVGDMVGALVGD